VTFLAVAGTGTEVGKTFVASALLRELHARGHVVAARKPVQSFSPGDESTDADVLAAAIAADPAEVCPDARRFPLPLAPPMAAEALGLEPFTIADLVAEARAAAPADALVVVETAGGVRSPIASDGDSADLIAALEPALVLLVADAGLGTINVVRLSAAALAPNRVVVYLNRFDASRDLHTRNRDWLRTRDGLDVVTDIEALAAFVERAERGRA
jgi:dethiobiotin synthetase